MSTERTRLEAKRILFPTDLTEGSLAVYPYAADMARLSGGEVTVLYLVDTLEAGLHQPIPLVSARAVEERMKACGQDRLRDLDAKFDHEHVPFKTEVAATDSVPDAIRDYARDHDVDLIVMGTHCKTGFTRLLCGSVAEETLRRSPCPVLMVRVT